jgi:hypothetical protein
MRKKYFTIEEQREAGRRDQQTYTARHPERVPAAREAWRMRNPARVAATKRRRSKRWRAAHPEQHAAHRAVLNAICRGDLTRPKNCSRCGAVGRIHGHHEDYGKPLEVIWLCNACHLDVHERSSAR